MSMAYFCLGIVAMVEQLMTQLQGSERPGDMVGFADDWNPAGSRDQMRNLFKLAARIGKEYGLELNLAKCRLATPFLGIAIA